MAGRGRLDAIDRLPDWADEAVAWAFTALKDRSLTQLEILDGFNERLRAAAWAEGLTDPDKIPQVSRSSFNRRAMRLASVGRRLEETRAIAAILTPKFEGETAEQITLLLSETIKTLTFEMLEEAGELKADGDTAEMLMMASRALKHAEEAKRISADTKSKILKEFTVKASSTVDAVAKAKGLSADTVDAIKAQILGIRAKP
ncbi:DUF3486 family protein [Azorhizobium doebereinerae]|uniref:DUF3486 family protein n=1 Tax=Azorhizobium doebereinerae TaxID=281091 RepID=UPI0003FD4B92|nr:DUF3486 family protein [Azorhizobium doebereinerae]